MVLYHYARTDSKAHWSVALKIPSRALLVDGSWQFCRWPCSRPPTEALCYYITHHGQQFCNFVFEFLQDSWVDVIQSWWLDVCKYILCIYFKSIYFFCLICYKECIWIGNQTASTVKNSSKSSLSFLHLLQPLLHLGHCVVPLILSWLPAFGVFTEFSSISSSILCKALFKSFLAFLISCLKLTCQFYGLSCSHLSKLSIS